MIRNAITVLLACAVIMLPAPGEEPTITDIHPLVPDWSPSGRAFHAGLSGTAQVLEGTFELPTTVPKVPRVICAFIIPLSGAGGKPAPSAQDVVLRFGWINERCLLEGDPVRAWATQCGFTVITVQWPDQPGMDRDVDKGFSIYPESGSGQVWDKALSQVRTIGRLPIRRAFAIGWSAGGTAAYQFADAHDAEVESVIAIAGRNYPEHPKFTGPVLLLRTEKDRLSENLELSRKLLALGTTVTQVTFPPNWLQRGRQEFWDHTVDGSAWDLAKAWVIALADQRSVSLGRIHPASQWLEVDGHKVPSEECRQAIHAMPSPPEAVEDHKTGRVILLAHPTAAQQPKGTIWWLDRRVDGDGDELLAPAEMLARRGFNVVATNDPLPSLREAVSALARVPSAGGPPPALIIVAPHVDDGADLAIAAPRLTRLIVLHPQPAILMPLLSAVQRQNWRVSLLADNEALHAITAEFKSASWLATSPCREVRTPGERLALDLDFLSTVWKE